MNQADRTDELRESQIRAPDGLALNVRRWGEDRIQILLLHGLGHGGFVWQPFLRALGPAFSSIALDLRGHGDSAWDPLYRYGASAHAQDAAGVLDAFGARDVILVGHSLGGATAILVAAADPARVRGVVLIEAGPHLHGHAGAFLHRQFNAQPWSYRSIEEYAAALERHAASVDPEVLQEFARHALRPRTGGGYDLKCDPALRSHLVPTPPALLERALRAIECPILVVRGAVSGLLSAAGAARTAAAARDARVLTVAAAGHGLLLENIPGLVEGTRPFINQACELACPEQRWTERKFST